MTISVTMLVDRYGEDGTLWEAASTHDATDNFAAWLVHFRFATATFPNTQGFVPTNAKITADGTYNILGPDGSVVALSELIPEVTPTHTDTTDYSGKTAYAGYRCTTAAGNITITCVDTSKVLVPTTALTVGSFPAYGAGHPGRVVIDPSDGDVRVVLSGAAVVYVGLE